MTKIFHHYNCDVTYNYLYGPVIVCNQCGKCGQNHDVRLKKKFQNNGNFW